MAINTAAYEQLIKELSEKKVTLVAVSKTKPAEDILALYKLGQRDFGENYVQELTDKETALPKDIRWHFIGHLQSNKVKYIAPFVHLIHGVDSLKLLQEINKQAAKYDRVIDCLLQVHIAEEETKFGMNETELNEAISACVTGQINNVRIKGLMGMASFTDNTQQVRKEFAHLRSLFDECNAAMHADFQILSMGMSGDYVMAIEKGSNMVRIGSLLFGARTYTK
ncbi:YggS family pyridoxal phosphate-dependent enzyme [Panacibacter ginsenosidivorans]|uniref:Pyridoxal phosphate homeostasis protein n=1 Tax=Panacibacter ginsenosidivorans TaxID=1813871 RepID=A0A5B8V6A9_9BACT|nr:YggS family pyridoxal phosphate-dependent enzyme [Panacibacter ginsenosidivorans]QEC66186.1 YggS family pyridoxal phosphate-dependent enzyme [Panacibacter ginsenosidivorans]